MSDRDSKAIVARFFEMTNQREYDAAEALLHDDLDWWLAGDPEKFFMAGSKSKEEAMTGLRQTATMSPDGMTLTPTGWVVDGDKVALEASVEGTFFNGDRYVNEFHFLIEVRDGKILRIKEYFDTQTANDVFSKVIQDAADR